MSGFIWKLIVKKYTYKTYFMNIHEHQAKELLKKFGAPVSKGVVIFSLKELKILLLKPKYMPEDVVKVEELN